jgi:RNA polymerase sigma factor for flagellar operon FliA
MRDRVSAALQALPAREQKIIRLYYFEEATMKQIGRAIGVNESRVSQLHARAITRLRQALEAQNGVRKPKLVARSTAVRRRGPAKPAVMSVRRRLRQVA